MTPAHTPTEWDCFYCGQSFMAQWGQVWCSPECRTAYEAAHGAEGAAPKKIDLAALGPKTIKRRGLR